MAFRNGYSSEAVESWLGSLDSLPAEITGRIAKKVREEHVDGARFGRIVASDNLPSNLLVLRKKWQSDHSAASSEAAVTSQPTVGNLTQIDQLLQEVFDSPGPPVPKERAASRRTKSAFTPEEDAKLQEWVKANPQKGELGNALWQTAEKRGVTSRSWSAMRQRWKTHLRSSRPSDRSKKRSRKASTTPSQRPVRRRRWSALKGAAPNTPKQLLPQTPRELLAAKQTDTPQELLVSRELLTTDVLPQPGWRRVASDQHPGKFYWFHDATREARWRRPVWEVARTREGTLYFVDIETGDTFWG